MKIAMAIAIALLGTAQPVTQTAPAPLSPQSIHSTKSGQVAPPSPAGKVLNLSGLSKAQIKALPSDQPIEFKGRRTTKRQLEAELQQKIQSRMQTLAPQIKAEDDKDEAEFQAMRKQLQEEHKARMAAKNQKIALMVKKLDKASPALVSKQAGDTIEAKARELYQRSKNASPQELATIEKEAGELLNQLASRGVIMDDKLPKKLPVKR